MNDKKSKLGLWLRRGAAGLLSLMLVFSLIQPGLARADAAYICGKEEHTHSDACYEIKTQQKTVQVLKCSLAEAVSAASEEDAAPGYVHTHGESCYVGEVLVCPLKEVKAHTHGAECYGKEPQCGQEEVEAHGHSDACRKELTCTQEHEHTEACYTAKECTLEETEGHTHSAECGYNLICEKPEIVLHEHDENCYAPMAADGEDKEPKLTCPIPEVIAHVHDGSCYEEKTEDVEVKSLTCGLEEHTHTDACVQKPEEKKPAWTCGKEAHTHTEGCYDAENTLTCTLDEHTHTDDCVQKPEEKKPAWTCGKEAHTHAEGCYDAENTLTCTLDEHTHTDACKAQEPEICEYCGVELTEDAVHAEDCLSLCTCEPVDDKHQDICALYVESDSEVFSGPAVNFTKVAPLRKNKRVPMFATWGLRNVSSPVDNPNIETSKTVRANNDGTYTLQLESYVTGRTVITETEEVTPADIVLVLDMTMSMEYCIKCGYKYGKYDGGPSNTAKCPNDGCIKRIDAMRTAVNAFLETVESSDVDHRVAVVTFSDNVDYTWSTSSTNPNRYLFENKGKNTGVLNIDEETHAVTFKDYDSSSNADRYQDALMQLNTGSVYNAKTCRQQIMTYLSKKTEQNTSGLAVCGATHPDYGMKMANWILSHSESGEGRDKIILFLSDGIPSEQARANTALSNAKICANSRGATIYTVGIFAGADGSKPTQLSYQNADFGQDNEDTVDTANTFMHLLSSNYPNADEMTTNISDYVPSDDGEGYYLTAADAENLTTIFNRIADQVTTGGSSIALGSSTKVMDIVTDSFYIPEGVNDVRAYSVDYAGDDAQGNKLWSDTEDSTTYSVEVNGRNVTVCGFDFAANYVGLNESISADGTTNQTPHGKKLVIEVDIKPNADFLGGNQVPTNTPMSGVYNDGALVEKFNVPKVDIALKAITPEFIDGKIYLSEKAVVPHISNVGSFSYTDSDNTTVNTQTDGINNDFVEILYTITDSAGKNCTYTLVAGQEYEDMDDISEWTVEDGFDLTPLLYDDVKYTVSAEIKPIYEGTITEPITKSKDSWIYVYKPEITFKDSVITLGDTADYENNFGKLEWKHGEIGANVEEMGPAPTLSYTYRPEPGAFQKETAVRITAVTPTAEEFDGQYNHEVPENQNICSKIIFYRQKNCTFPSCEMHSAANDRLVKAEGESWTNFTVHLNSYDVTIEKKMAQGSDDIYQDAGYKVDVTITSDKLTTGMEIEYVNADGTSGQQAVTTAGTVTLKNIIVKAGKPATIKCVPYNAVYEIKETSGYGYKDSYGYVVESKAITEGVNVGPGATGTVTNEELSAEVFIKGSKVVRNPDGENHTFTFALEQVKDAEGTPLADTGKRHKDQSIDVKVSGEKADFSFGELTYETSDLAGGTVDGNAKVKTFYYLVTEATQDDWKTLDADETEFIVEVTLTGKQGELKAEITDILENDVSKGADYPIEFRNTLLGSLTVKKSVVGGGNPSDSFKFRLKLDKAYDGTYLAEQNDVDTTLTIKDGLAEFWLRRNEEITIYGLPHGLEVEVYEFDAEEYRAYHKIDTSLTRKGQTANAQVSTDGTTVKYINYDIDSEWLPQTGQLKWPVLVLAALGIGLLGFGALTRKRKRNGK